MALEKECGFNELPFMNSDVNMDYADVSTETAQNNNDAPYTVMAPPFVNPVRNLNNILAEKNIKLNLTHGTITLGLKYRGGILLCSDTRPTMNDTIIAHSKKIVEFDKFTLGTIAGYDGDCAHWNRVLTTELILYRMINCDANIPVSIASKYVNEICNRFVNMGLNIGLILAGYDPQPDGPKLMYINNDGDHIDGHLFAVGSGSSYALSVLDHGYNYNMSDEEAFDLARRAVQSAIISDPYSGGFIRVYHLTEEGWKQVPVADRYQLMNVQPDLVTRQHDFVVPMEVDDDDN